MNTPGVMRLSDGMSAGVLAGVHRLVRYKNQKTSRNRRLHRSRQYAGEGEGREMMQTRQTLRSQGNIQDFETNHAAEDVEMQDVIVVDKRRSRHTTPPLKKGGRNNERQERHTGYTPDAKVPKQELVDSEEDAPMDVFDDVAPTGGKGKGRGRGRGRGVMQPSAPGTKPEKTNKKSKNDKKFETSRSRISSALEIINKYSTQNEWGKLKSQNIEKTETNIENELKKYNLGTSDASDVVMLELKAAQKQVLIMKPICTRVAAADDEPLDENDAAAEMNAAYGAHIDIHFAVSETIAKRNALNHMSDDSKFLKLLSPDECSPCGVKLLLDNPNSSPEKVGEFCDYMVSLGLAAKLKESNVARAETRKALAVYCRQILAANIACTQRLTDDLAHFIVLLEHDKNSNAKIEKMVQALRDKSGSKLAKMVAIFDALIEAWMECTNKMTARQDTLAQETLVTHHIVESQSWPSNLEFPVSEDVIKRAGDARAALTDTTSCSEEFHQEHRERLHGLQGLLTSYATQIQVHHDHSFQSSMGVAISELVSATVRANNPDQKAALQSCNEKLDELYVSVKSGLECGMNKIGDLTMSQEFQTNFMNRRVLIKELQEAMPFAFEVGGLKGKPTFASANNLLSMYPDGEEGLSAAGMPRCVLWPELRETIAKGVRSAGAELLQNNVVKHKQLFRCILTWSADPKVPITDEGLSDQVQALDMASVKKALYDCSEVGDTLRQAKLGSMKIDCSEVFGPDFKSTTTYDSDLISNVPKLAEALYAMIELSVPAGCNFPNIQKIQPGHNVRITLLSARVLSVLVCSELMSISRTLWRKNGGCLCGECKGYGHDGVVVMTLFVLVLGTPPIVTKVLCPYPLVLVSDVYNGHI